MVKLKKSSSRSKDVIDLIQYIVYIFCGLLGVSLTNWIKSETIIIKQQEESKKSPDNPNSQQSTPESTELTTITTQPKSPTLDVSIITVKIDEIKSTTTINLDDSSLSSSSSVTITNDDENKNKDLQCPEAFIEIYQVNNTLYNQQLEKLSSSTINLLYQWIIRLSLIISITLVNWNLGFKSFSPAMEMFAWSSNISQLTVGIMASTIISNYIRELLTIKSSFDWINLFTLQCSLYSDKMLTTVKSADLNQLIDYISSNYNRCLSMVTFTSPLKKFAFSLLFTIYLISLTTLILDSTQSILTFKSTSGYTLITLITSIISIVSLFSTISSMIKSSTKCSSALCQAMLAYPNQLNTIYPRLELIRSSIFTIKPKLKLFGSIALELPLFLMMSIIFMVEITRYVN